MSFDLDSYSARELDTLITQARRRKTTLKKRKPVAAVRKKLNDMAAAEGYTVAELFGGRTAKAGVARKAAKTGRKAAKKGRKFGKVAPKYRNPANRTETWTGRGKHPRWMAALMKKGRKPEDFLIRK